MATRSSIMDTNSYRDGNGEVLDEATKELIERREKYMGGAYRLFYRKPVNLVRGQGEYLWDAEGTQYLDMYNNVAGVGHCNPAVVDAVDEQMKLLNTHTRYLHTRIVDYSEEILAMLPKEIDKIMYMCTGSEANDLALRVAWEYTGGKGIIISQEAYHGTSALTSGCSPALGSEQPLLPYVRKISTPDYFRHGGTPEEFSSWYASEMQKKIDELNAVRTSCFAARAETGIPFPMGFPMVTMSGMTPWRANPQKASPQRANPGWTSSAMNTPPFLWTTSTADLTYPMGSGCTPSEEKMESARKQANG